MPNAITRRPSAIQYEGMRAMLSLAGIRQVKQATLTVTLTDVTYTVTEPGTRRVVLIHAGTAFNIRFNLGAAATATSFPILGSTYVVVDAEKDQVLHFIAIAGGTDVLSIMEIE